MEDRSNHATGDWSRILVGKEQILATMHRKDLAVVWVARILLLFLEETRFVVRTDHESPRWILTMTEDTEKLAR